MKEKETKLDSLDKKILYYLDRNSRQSVNEIAKKCRVHKNVVNFRMNRLQKKGVIKQFVAMISPSVLGLTPYKLYLQVQNFTSEKEKLFLTEIKKMPIYWFAKVDGQWDFIVGILTKNAGEFNKFKDAILFKFGEDIIKKKISILVEAPHYYKDYLNDKEKSPVKYWIKENRSETIDDKDAKILRILAHNARTPIVGISDKLNLSVKTVISRIKKLEKKGIIYDYRISLDLNKIDMNFFKCFITLGKYNPKRVQDFKDYCHKNPHITHLIECVGDWDFEPEFELNSLKEFHTEIEKIKNNFHDIIRNIETFNILEEYSYVCLP